MEGASDALMDVMSDIVDRAQQLAKDKIARLPIAGNQQTGPPDYNQPTHSDQQHKVRRIKPAKEQEDTTIRGLGYERHS